MEKKNNKGKGSGSHKVEQKDALTELAKTGVMPTECPPFKVWHFDCNIANVAEFIEKCLKIAYHEKCPNTGLNINMRIAQVLVQIGVPERKYNYVSEWLRSESKKENTKEQAAILKCLQESYTMIRTILDANTANWALRSPIKENIATFVMKLQEIRLNHLAVIKLQHKLNNETGTNSTNPNIEINIK